MLYYQCESVRNEYFMAISAVADPPVAIRIRFSAMTLCDRCIAHHFLSHTLRPFLPQYDPAIVQRLIVLVGKGHWSGQQGLSQRLTELLRSEFFQRQRRLLYIGQSGQWGSPGAMLLPRWGHVHRHALLERAGCPACTRHVLPAEQPLWV